MENAMLNNNTLLRIIEFLGYPDAKVLESLHRNWHHRFNEKRFWEKKLNINPTSTLQNCFRRASKKFLRHYDAPPPNVNRTGLPCRANGVMIHCGMQEIEYSKALQRLDMELKHFEKEGLVLKTKDTKMDKIHISGRRGAKMEVAAGGYRKETGLKFSLFRVNGDRGHLFANIVERDACCYDSTDTGVAVGLRDGTIKVYGYDAKVGVTSDGELMPSYVLGVSHRSFLGFKKSSSAYTKIYLDAASSRSEPKIATVKKSQTVSIWNAKTNAIMLTIPSTCYTESNLPRIQNSINPKVSTLQLQRDKVIIASTNGAIRIFDLRSGKLSCRIAGPPSSVLQTIGGYLWTGSLNGKVCRWTGNYPKVVHPPPLCSGSVSDLQVHHHTIVAGYEDQGLSAWDLRFTSSICSFSNSNYGGIQKLNFDTTKIISKSNFNQIAFWRWDQHLQPSCILPNTYSTFTYDDQVLLLGNNNQLECRPFSV